MGAAATEGATATSPGRRWARFDDLCAGSALLFPPPEREVVAARPDEVAPALEQVQEAVADGAWAYGCVAYEAASGLDPQLPAREPPPGHPLAWFGVGAAPTPTAPVATPAGAREDDGRWRPHWSDADHAAAVASVRRRIADGDTYQTNLTDRLHGHVEDLLDLYARMATAQGGAYNAYLDLGGSSIVSASPELFFEWTADRLRTRPMKGTARRGRTALEDDQSAAALRAGPKERAENLIVVDLLRNDLSRLAEPGSVRVDELFALERYPTVWQLTSTVSARPRRAMDLVDVFRALFPCGSVTGAPKRRTMQVIAELEPQPRGIYCGAIGFVAPPATHLRARFSVAIRTAVVDRASGRAVYGVGGGITWDSDPTSERAEALSKAAVLTHGAIGRAGIPQTT